MVDMTLYRQANDCWTGTLCRQPDFYIEEIIFYHCFLFPFSSTPTIFKRRDFAGIQMHVLVPQGF
jgi:hypothetical protein